MSQEFDDVTHAFAELLSKLQSANDDDKHVGLRSKLMGQVSLARIAKVPVVDVMEPPGQRPTAHPFPWSMRGSKVLCVRPRWNCREDYASMP